MQYIEPESIATITTVPEEKRQIEHLFLGMEMYKKSLQNWAITLFHKIQDEDIQHLVYLSRQGTLLKALMDGIYSVLPDSQPTSAHLAVSRSIYLTKETPEYVGAISEILHTELPGRKAFVDDRTQDFVTREKIMRLAKEFDSESEYTLEVFGDHVPWDISFAVVDDWSPHIYLSNSISSHPKYGNPGTVREVNDEKSKYFHNRLNGILWDWGREAAYQMLEAA